MAKVKVRTNFSFKKDIKAAQSKSSRAIKSKIVDLVLNEYNKGISPVKGFNAYKKYRPSTAKKKGRIRPVTLKETGELHRSLKAVQKSSTSIELKFMGSRNAKIAGYHQFGTPNMDARPMLPTKGQTFKKRLIDKFNKIIDRILNLYGERK